MSDSPTIQDNVTEASFAERVLQASQHVPVVVDFWADWCAPCRMLMPMLARLADEYQGQFVLAKVNTDEQQALAARYGIRSLPTVKVFKNGEVVDEFMGVQPESAIRAILERHIERASDRLVDQAAEALEAGDEARARSLLEQAVDMDPANPRVKIGLARTLMQTGEPERAEIILDDLQGEAREQPEVKTLKAQLAFARIASEAPEREALERRVTADPADLEARYHLSAHQVLAGEFEPALEQLLEVLKRERGFRGDAARKALLAIFEILGGGELVTRYRSRMFNILH
jgi:putative thioredoxin